jgi:hypothetical protein
MSEKSVKKLVNGREDLDFIVRFVDRFAELSSVGDAVREP